MPNKSRVKLTRYREATIRLLFREHSVRAWTLRALIVAGFALLFVSYFLGKDGIRFEIATTIKPLYQQLRGFKLAEIIALITPVVALLTAWFAHYGDERYGGRGIKHVVKQMGQGSYNLETEVIAGSMTKQSVLAAIASILVALIQQYQTQTTFGNLIKFLTTCGFGFTILFLLVSMVCYDYASRFQWRPHHKAQLVRKALLLDVWSWYFLLTSFVLSLALINARLSVATCVSAGLLMWWYYFFPGRRRFLDRAENQKESDETNELPEQAETVSVEPN
jgi:uncharacterized membrane protein